MNASPAATHAIRRALLADAHLYLCTDSRIPRGNLRKFLHVCYKGSTDIIQLRSKKVDTRDETAAVEAFVEATAKHGELFAINGRANIAALIGAGILHMGQEDLITEQAYQIVGSEALIGRSSRNLGMLTALLADDGIDYAVIGPVYAILTKPNRQSVGVNMAREAAALVRRARAQGSAESHQDSIADIVRPHDRNTSDPIKPQWVIGDISAGTVGEIIGAGAERIVMVHTLIETANPEKTMRALRAAVTGVNGIDSRGNEQ